MKHFAKIVAVLFLATSLFSSVWAAEAPYYGGKKQSELLKGTNQVVGYEAYVRNYTNDEYTVYAVHGNLPYQNMSLGNYYPYNYITYPLNGDAGMYATVIRNYDHYPVAINYWVSVGNTLAVVYGNVSGNKLLGNKPVVKIEK